MDNNANMKRIAGWVLLIGMMCCEPGFSAITVGAWQPIYRGVAYATGSADASEARLQQVRAVRLDLLDAGIVFMTTPGNGSASLDTVTVKTSTFLKNNSLKIAINAGFFGPTGIGINTDISGLQINRGALVSEATNSFGNCILRITASNVAAFATISSLPYNTNGIYNAVPGSHFILNNGVPSTDNTDPQPRSLAGISADGRFLVLVTIDGRQSGYSEGATYKECGEWLLRYGSYNGLNLDGGGSTTLVRSDDSGGAIILNRPIDSGIPGWERYVGSHLGLSALALPSPYTVTFDAQGGSVSPGSATVTNGLTYGVLPVPAKSGFTFTGWWTATAGTGLPVTSATVVASASSHTLYASWVGTPCTVTFDAQGGAVSPSGMTVTNGAAYGTLPVPTRADYSFGGWWTGTGGAGTQVTAATVVATAADHTVYARWDAIPIVPIFNMTGSTGRVPFIVTFADQSAGTITNRYWDFGDGTWTNTTATNLMHLYTNAGAYIVRLVASGPGGSSVFTNESPVVVYGWFANPIPYQETFEPPEFQSGDPLIVPWNTNGWYGDTNGYVAVTNLAYAWAAGNYPVSSTSHTAVLLYKDALLTNLFAAADLSHSVVDLMMKPEFLESAPDETNMPSDGQMAFFADTNRHLNVWCSGDQNHTNRIWVTFTNTVIGVTNWGRLTVAFDYDSDTVLGLTYFSLAMNGVPLTVPDGLGHAYAGGRFVRRADGAWLVSATPTAKQMNSVTIRGTGHLDDFAVSTNAPAFLPFPESGKARLKGTLMIVR